MEHINIDFDRHRRTGFPEVIFGASKTTEALENILKEHLNQGRNALVTKLQKDKAEQLGRIFPDHFYDLHSGCFMLTYNEDGLSESGVAIISAGTSDAFVVNEAYYTLAFLGQKAVRIGDIGVAGLHRLMGRLDDIQKYSVLIVVAGFEGALPTVLAGLVPQPVIAVPASVGYGVAEGGITALHSMLSSCANGVTVVNIDNGYGAAMAAFRILQQIKTIK